MLHTTINNLKDLLIEVEGADIQSKDINSGNQQHLHTVADIQTGRFRRLFDRHRKAYRLFN